jgi:hypothetical protein
MTTSGFKTDHFGSTIGKPSNNPILQVPLNEVMRSEIALPLQQVLKLYTVGSFLRAWANPLNHQRIERVFDSPEQARHAASVCAGWLGCRATFTPPAEPILGWWREDAHIQVQAA